MWRHLPPQENFRDALCKEALASKTNERTRIQMLRASKALPFAVFCTYLAIFTTWSAFLVRGLIPWSSCSSGVTIRERWLSRNRSIKRFSFCRVKFRSARQYCTAFSKCFFPAVHKQQKNIRKTKEQLDYIHKPHSSSLAPRMNLSVVY